jgi:hypothetical protein
MLQIARMFATGKLLFAKAQGSAIEAFIQPCHEFSLCRYFI